MSVPVWLRWTLLGLLGLAVAAGVSVAASHLVSQRIGLASEPLSAGRELAPQPRGESRRPQDRHPQPDRPTTTTTATTTPAPPPSTTTTVAPYSGPTTPSAPAPPPAGGGEREGGDD